MSPFKPSMLTLALAAAGIVSPVQAAEPASADDNIEVIQISGIRSSLQASQATKRDESSVVEAISAEEIGKLPDVSIAESLARLPGIATQRLDGRANVVSIRGLAPDFTTATLNGREQVTIGDNRGVEFDQYPSELLNSVVVYKTPDASVLAQAIGGTVDLQTISPLAHGERTIAINMRGEKNSLGKLNSNSKDMGYRASISYIDQFADDTIGIALGYARLSSPNQEERWSAWGYPNVKDGDKRIILGGAKPYVRSSLLERDGFMGVFEYQPNDFFKSELDVFYSKFSEEQTLRGTEIPGAVWGGFANKGVVINKAENGLVTDYTLKNAKILVRNDVNMRDADTLSLGWRNTFQLNDNWTLISDLSFSKADRQDIGLETYAGTSRGNGCTPGGCEDLRVTMNGDTGATFHPGLNYADPNLVKLGGPFNWGNNKTVKGNAQDGFINRPSVKDELKAFRLTAERVFDDGVFSSVEFGLNAQERTKSKEDNGVFLTLKDYPNTVSVPTQFLQRPTSLGFIGMGNILSYDALALYRSGIYKETDEGKTVASRARNTWDVTEKVYTGYVKANIETEVFDRGLTGNFGVQVVNTKQSSNGLRTNVNKDGLIELANTYGEHSFTEVLPSMNFNLEVADSKHLRFAAARTLARARMDRMNASFNVDYDPKKATNTDVKQSPWSGGSGNPELDPWMAWQYDLSYEYYMDTGYVSVAGFYKDLENYIYEEKTLANFDGIKVPGAQPKLRQGYLSKWQNGEGGHISGIEVAAHLTGDLIHESLKGFGVITSGSVTESKVREKKDSEPTNLPGLSKKVANFTAYYEDYGFQARISARYRSDFLGEVSGLSLKRDLKFVKGETVVDAQIGYDFSQSNFKSLDGLSVLFQVTNLTDEPFTTYQNGDKRQVRDHQIYGRNFMLGFNYKM